MSVLTLVGMVVLVAADHKAHLPAVPVGLAILLQQLHLKVMMAVEVAPTPEAALAGVVVVEPVLLEAIVPAATMAVTAVTAPRLLFLDHR